MNAKKATKLNNSMVALVMDQAATGREVIGTVVTMVPDNKEYKVTAIDTTEKTVTVTEVLPEGSDAVADVVELSEKNAHIAHYVNNPNERPVPSVDVNTTNGKSTLVFEDGPEVSCGRIKVVSVLGTIKGTVLLITENVDSDKMIDIMAYDVQSDEFRMVHDNFSVADADIKFFRMADDIVLVNERLIVTEEQKDENGNVVDTYDVLKYNNLYQVRESGELHRISNGEVYDEDADEYVDIDFPIVESMKLVTQADRRDLVILSVSEDKNGKIEATKPTLRLYRVDRSGNICNTVGAYVVNSKNARVYLGGASGSAPVITIKDKDQVLITTARGTITVDEPKIVTAMNGFNYFDGVYAYEDEDGNTGAKWYFSNKAREEVIFTSVETDRGTLFNLVQA